MNNKKRLGLEVRVVSNMIKRKVDEIIGSEGTKDLTGVQGWIIGYIYDNSKQGAVFQKDIEKEFNIRRSTATGILQLLEKNNYINRESVASDARLKKLVLTEKAKITHENIEFRIEEFESNLQKGLTIEELDTFYLIMEKVKKNLE